MRPLLLASVLLTGCAATQPPIGPWAPFYNHPNNKPEVKADWLAMQAEACLPTAAEVPVPVFPGAEVHLLAWSKKQPDCGPPLKPGAQHLGIYLLSKASPADVERWYDSRMAGFRRQTEPDAVYYVDGIPGDLSLGHLRQVRYVGIYPLLGLYAEHGYRTIIDIHDPGPLRPAPGAMFPMLYEVDVRRKIIVENVLESDEYEFPHPYPFLDFAYHYDRVFADWTPCRGAAAGWVGRADPENNRYLHELERYWISKDRRTAVALLLRYASAGTQARDKPDNANQLVTVTRIVDPAQSLARRGIECD